MTKVIACFVLSYLVGSIPSGVVLSRLMGFPDPRSGGSGNIGATNVMRVGGKLPAILTLAMDVFKGFLPTIVFSKLFGSQIMGLMSGFFAFFGHLYPIYLGFKGGKGVATALGVFLYISPFSVLILAGVFLVVLALKGVVSLSSIVASSLLPFIVLSSERDVKLFLCSLLFSFFIVLKHKPNIERMRSGEEKRIFRGILG